MGKLLWPAMHRADDGRAGGERRKSADEMFLAAMRMDDLGLPCTHQWPQVGEDLAGGVMGLVDDGHVDPARREALGQDARVQQDGPNLDGPTFLKGGKHLPHLHFRTAPEITRDYMQDSKGPVSQISRGLICHGRSLLEISSENQGFGAELRASSR